MGHRFSEWMSRAVPQEDIALSNVALDFIGRARLFYQYAAQRIGGTPLKTPLPTAATSGIYQLLLCELPRGDFAFTICRQFPYDAFALPFTEALSAAIRSWLPSEARRSRKVVAICGAARTGCCAGDGTEESHRAASGRWTTCGFTLRKCSRAIRCWMI